jgi:hypothetical protein
VAARLASALDLAPHSSAHAFHVSRPWVTWVSIPLVMTRTSPAVVALVGSCCCWLVDIAEHPAANWVPRATGAVVARVGVIQKEDWENLVYMLRRPLGVCKIT